jgi:hypothetical protein
MISPDSLGVPALSGCAVTLGFCSTILRVLLDEHGCRLFGQVRGGAHEAEVTMLAEAPLWVSDKTYTGIVKVL